MKKILLILLLLKLSTSHAIEIQNQKISRIGSHNGQTIFLYLESNELTNHGCAYSVLYCPSSNPDCKSMLSIALTARTTQSNSVYFAFDKDANNMCNITHISF